MGAFYFFPVVFLLLSVFSLRSAVGAGTIDHSSPFAVRVASDSEAPEEQERSGSFRKDAGTTTTARKVAAMPRALSSTGSAAAKRLGSGSKAARKAAAEARRARVMHKAEMARHKKVIEDVKESKTFEPDVHPEFNEEYPGVTGGVWDFSGEVDTPATPQSPDPVVAPIG